MNRQHYDLLKSCSDKKDITEWNLYRLRNPNEKIDLKFVSLNDFYLLEANLQNINFKFTSLKNVKLNGAIVDNISLAYYKMFIGIFMVAMVLFMSLSYYFNINLIKETFSEVAVYDKYIHYFITSLLASAWFLVNTFSYINTFRTSVLKRLSESIGITLFLFGLIFTILFFPISYFSTLLAWYIIVGVLILILHIFIKEFVDDQSKSIANAKNPTKAINFNSKFLSQEKESEKLREELSQLENQSKEQEKIKEELKDYENFTEERKMSFQARLKMLEDQENKRNETERYLRNRIEIIEKRDNQEEDIKNSMDAIKKSFSHIKTTEESFFYMKVLYTVLLTIGLIMLCYFGYISFAHREETFLKLANITLNNSLGIVIFYATPILFSFVIIVFAIVNLNKNIKDREKLLEKKYLIELIESTFYAQIRNGDDAKDAMQKLIKKLADSAYEKLSLESNKFDIKQSDIVKKNYYDVIKEKNTYLAIKSLLNTGK